MEEAISTAARTTDSQMMVGRMSEIEHVPDHRLGLCRGKEVRAGRAMRRTIGWIEFDAAIRIEVFGKPPRQEAIDHLLDLLVSHLALLNEIARRTE